jgi:hypothetical protein
VAEPVSLGDKKNSPSFSELPKANGIGVNQWHKSFN